jgi:hypothetical protein
LVVGKFEKPHHMKGVKHYQHDYEARTNAWVTANIFRKWLLCSERKMARKRTNILLLLV